MTRWLVPALAATLPLHAAIITERNDVFSIFPESATFRGTSAAPGIGSQWIPYGTYTGGTGGTEYMRVTSNLVGVVASAYDGLWERDNIANYGYTNRENNARGELWTNSTMRVLDRLNAGMHMIEYRWDGSIITNSTYGASILEDMSSDGLMRRGLGSRRLDALCGDVAPPVPTSWTPDFASFLSATNDWANVWPTYQATTNDGVFVTGRSEYWREHVDLFLAELSYCAGSDYERAVDELLDALRGISAATSITNVLAYDTGFTTNDFAHWRNMTTRLDWKRLGLICQMERQMEEMHEYRAYTSDELPFYSFAASAAKGYRGTLSGVTVSIPADARGSYASWSGPSMSDIQWELASNRVEVTTNDLGRCHPTARFDGKADLSALWEHDHTGGGNNLGWDTGIIYADLEARLMEALSSSPMEFPHDGTSRFSFDLYTDGEASSMFGLAFSIRNFLVTMDDEDAFRDLGYGFEAGLAGGLPIDALHFAAEMRKFASASYTVADVAGLVTNLDLSVTHNDTYFWDGGWIASRSLPTLELMISATNDIGDVDAPMRWDDVSAAATNGAERVFRLSPESPENARSATQLRGMRAAAVLSLDRAVKAKFAELAGQGAGDIASSRAQFAPGDEQRMWDFIDGQDISYNLVASALSWRTVYGSVTISGGEATSVTIGGQTGGEFPVGEWKLTLSGTSYDFTTNTTPARVDGHQSQVLKTLWRFKNLRDPEL